MKNNLSVEKRVFCLLSVFVISIGVAIPVYAGSYQVSTGAVYYESGFLTIEKIVDNGAPNSIINFDETADIVLASSDLATGKLKVEAVSNLGSGRAGWIDEVDLEISGRTPRQQRQFAFIWLWTGFTGPLMDRQRSVFMP